MRPSSSLWHRAKWLDNNFLRQTNTGVLKYPLSSRPEVPGLPDLQTASSLFGHSLSFPGSAASMAPQIVRTSDHLTSASIDSTGAPTALGCSEVAPVAHWLIPSDKSKSSSWTGIASELSPGRQMRLASWGPNIVERLKAVRRTV